MAPNGMHDSQVLNSEIFGEQPHGYKLEEAIRAKLAQMYPGVEGKSSEVQDAICRIGSLWETLASFSQNTRERITSLYAETVVTTRLSDLSNKVAILEAHQQNRIATILGASNDDKFSQAA